MTQYYTEFKNWRLGPIQLPWPYRFIGETNDYRHKDKLNVEIYEDQIKNVFLSFDESKISRFLANHIPAAIVGIRLEAESADAAIKIIEQHFGPIKLFGIMEITDGNREQINKVMEDVIV